MRARETAGFSEPEIQVLIALVELSDPIETPNNNFYAPYPATIEEAAAYFRELKVDWSGAFESLETKGLIGPGKAGSSLTESGIRLAREIRRARPPNYYWYEYFYARAPGSPAFSVYCERLYGAALCQDGFSGVDEVRAMLKAARIRAGDRVLDLGCGAGLISEFIHGETGARVTGVDYSPTAIARAKRISGAEIASLTFIEGDFDDLEFAPGSFDAIISIDTLYMPKDLGAALRTMAALLAPGGRMAAYYTHLLSNPYEPRADLRPERNPLGRALDAIGLRYRAFDHSAANHRFLQRKRLIAESMRQDFAAEGLAFLYDYLIEQSEADPAPYDPGTATASRYLYLIDLGSAPDIERN